MATWRDPDTVARGPRTAVYALGRRADGSPLLQTTFPQVAPGPILIEPRPRFGPAHEHDHAQVGALPEVRPCARARSCAGWCPPRGSALRTSTIMRRLVPSPRFGPAHEHDHAQVGALPEVRPCARARSCAGWCPPRGSALRTSTILRRLVPSPRFGPAHEHDHAQVGALPEVRPCARARSCAGWCPPRGSALRTSTIMRRLVPSPRFGPAHEHDHAQVGALPEVRPCARARSCAGWCPPRGSALRTSTIMRRLVPSPRFGPAHEHDHAQVGALPEVRPCARARSCAGWCPPRGSARAAADIENTLRPHAVPPPLASTTSTSARQCGRPTTTSTITGEATASTSVENANMPDQPPKLSAAQMRTLYTLVMEADPRQFEFEFASWSRDMVRALIRRELRVSLSGVSVGRLLRTLGLSPQWPSWRASQADPDAVGRGRLRSSRRSRAQAKATVYFADEAGIRWAITPAPPGPPVGQTPAVKATCARHSVNMISAVTAEGLTAVHHVPRHAVTSTSRGGTWWMSAVRSPSSRRAVDRYFTRWGMSARTTMAALRAATIW